MGGGAGWATVHGVAKSRRRPSDFTFTFLSSKNTCLFFTLQDSERLPSRWSSDVSFCVWAEEGQGWFLHLCASFPDPTY